MGRSAFRNSLLKHRVFGLDTSCFIYQFEKHPVYSPLTRELFLILKKKRAVVSSITFSELVARKKIFNNKRIRSRYRVVFQTTPNTRIIDVDLNIAEYSAGLRLAYGFRLPDAFHLATAILSGANVFITNDKKFKKVKEIPIVILKDYVKK